MWSLPSLAVIHLSGADSGVQPSFPPRLQRVQGFVDPRPGWVRTLPGPDPPRAWVNCGHRSSCGQRLLCKQQGTLACRSSL
ncbi:unnamed protein product [Boreogadus saida]